MAKKIILKKQNYFRNIFYKRGENMIVIHYGEIAIKGKNRNYFEKKLISNINLKIKPLTTKKAKKIYGRLILDENSEKIQGVLKKIHGICSFSPAIACDLDIKKISKAAETLAEKDITYRIETKRQNKKFLLNSPEINREIALYLDSKGKKADLRKFDDTIYTEITDKEAFIYSKKVKGLGGLPVGCTGKVLCLLSGGIDSPVASYLMQKRGCVVDFIHFFNDTINSKSALNKIKELAQIIHSYQNQTNLYIIPFKDLQKEIILKIPAKYRMIVYKRYMFKIANTLARKKKIKAVVTGDNLAQVASQTLENIYTTYEASTIPVLHPLIGFDKTEIIDLAKNIGTYETSILPYGDCCSLLIAKHPETKSKLKDILQLEKEIDNSLIEKAIKNIEKIEY